MSLSDRRHVLKLLALLPLAACGYSPVYAPGASATKLRGGILMDTPVDEDSFDLVRQVEQRLGRPDTPIYGLSIRPQIEQQGLAIEGANDITRFNVIGVADYALRDLGTGQVLTSGRVDSFTSYSATGTQVSTVAAERDARTRLMIALADLVIARLVAASDGLTV